MDFNGFWMEFHNFSMDFNGFQWFLMDFNDFQLFFNAFHAFSMVFNGILWISMIFNGFQWIPTRAVKSSRMHQRVSRPQNHQNEVCVTVCVNRILASLTKNQFWGGGPVEFVKVNIFADFNVFQWISMIFAWNSIIFQWISMVFNDF